MSTQNPRSQFLKAFAHIKVETVVFCKSARNMSWFESGTEHLITCLTLKRSFKMRLISMEWLLSMDKQGGSVCADTHGRLWSPVASTGVLA